MQPEKLQMTLVSVSGALIMKNSNEENYCYQKTNKHFDQKPTVLIMQKNIIKIFNSINDFQRGIL